MLWAEANELRDKITGNAIPIGIGGALLFALILLFKVAMRRKIKHPDLEKVQREDLAEYPPPPPVNARRLTVNGQPVRVRLVVVAPTGKRQAPLTADDVPQLLDNVFRGLGGLLKADKPRVRIWPPQLSVTGFGPTFHRLVVSPDDEGAPSHWVKLAGPARTGKQPILLGLAVLADEDTTLGNVQVETTEWGELLQIEK